MQYLLRRIIHGLVLLLAVSALSFLLAELAPGDFLADLELDPGVSEGTVQLLRERYGLDRSLGIRYLEWLRSVVTGEFGFSIRHQTAAGALLLPRAWNTLILAATALLLAWLLAVPAGIWSAYRRGGVVDRLAVAASSLLLASPTIVLALALLLVAGHIRWLPIGGMNSLDFEGMGALARIADRLRHLALPALALALAAFPVVYRHTRSAVAEVLEASFLNAGRAQGIPLPRLLFQHALKAAANPLISLFGLSVAGLLSGSLLVEVIMGWPGMGPLMLDAILARDVHLVVGAVLLSSIFLVAGNLLADLLLFWIDPRTREG